MCCVAVSHVLCSVLGGGQSCVVKRVCVRSVMCCVAC